MLRPPSSSLQIFRAAWTNAHGCMKLRAVSSFPCAGPVHKPSHTSTIALLAHPHSRKYVVASSDADSTIHPEHRDVVVAATLAQPAILVLYAHTSVGIAWRLELLESPTVERVLFKQHQRNCDTTRGKI